MVEVGVDAARDHPAIGEAERWFGDNGGLDLAAQIGEIVNRVVELEEAAAGIVTGELLQRGPDAGQATRSFLMIELDGLTAARENAGREMVSTVVDPGCGSTERRPKACR